MVHIQSELVRLLMRIGYAAAWQGLHKEAVAIFEGVGAVRPESEVPIIGASVVAMIAGNHDVAVQVLKEGALDLNPDSDLARVHLGVALRLRGDEERGSPFCGRSLPMPLILSPLLLRAMSSNSPSNNCNPVFNLYDSSHQHCRRPTAAGVYPTCGFDRASFIRSGCGPSSSSGRGRASTCCQFSGARQSTRG